MPGNRLCIICGARKAEALFEKKGEHIVPRSLGNRKLRTPHVCRECNGGLGGTVDLAFKNVPGIARACFDRDVGGMRSKRRGTGADADAGIVQNLLDINELSAVPACQSKLYDGNPDLKGAILKIVFEAAHLRLGNDWLSDPAADAIRIVLLAYVNKDKPAAREYADGVPIRHIPADVFYHAVGKPRGELLKRAITSKSCLNALWLVPVKASPDHDAPLPAVVYDIEGLPLGCVVVGASGWGVAGAALLWP